MRRHHRFQAMVAAFTVPLYRYAVWLTKDLSLADDLVQETYCRAWRGLDQLGNENAAKAWLMRILRNEYLRALERRPDVDTEASIEAIADQYSYKAPTPEILALRHAVAKLGPELREPLILQVVHGYSLHEIADMLSIPVNTVATRVFRARRHLRKVLSDEAVAPDSIKASS